MNELNRDLSESKERIEQADQELRDHADNLEAKINERTQSLEKSKQAVEDLKKKVEEALHSERQRGVSLRVKRTSPVFCFLSSSSCLIQ